MLDIEESKQEAEAKKYIKNHGKELIKKFADPDLHKAVARPVSLFMAGSPGAGKTEVSRSLTSKFQSMPIRIDADEIRKMCPGYNGSNAHVFQQAAVKGVNILFDHALHNELHLILDGTFAYGNAMDNIHRSIQRGRVVELWYVYQAPVLAWEFTQIREAVEARRVSKERFIHAFLQSKLNVKEAKDQFGDQIELNLLIKNIDNSGGEFKLNIRGDELDRYLGDGYTEDELKNILK